jgi:tetratricopeptide (TPR) repeat protein
MSANHYARTVARPKRRHPRPARNPTPGGVPAPAVAPALRPVPRAILAWAECRRRWIFRCAALVLVPALLLGIFEGALHLLHIGYPTQFFLRTEDGKFYTSNQKYCWPFFPRDAATQPNLLLMEARKSPGTHRVFILGESAAAGSPDPSYGFARILELLLREQFPEKRFEVINAAVRGINSHLLVPIARECAAHEPDLAIVYMGNNESVGLHAPDPGRFNPVQLIVAPRLVQALKTTRTAQLFFSALKRLSGHHQDSLPEQDMEFFRKKRLAADDSRRLSVHRYFQRNLEKMCRCLSRAGAQVIACTVPVNLKDSPPFASLHKAGLTDQDKARWDTAYNRGTAARSGQRYPEALKFFQEAERLDDHFADLHFRLAECYDALEEIPKALQHYTLARDWDALPFRTQSRINDLIRQSAADRENKGLYLLDLERCFARSPLSDRGVPGQHLFNDHVHLSFAGDYLAACSLLPVVAQALHLGPADQPPLTQEVCARRLAFTTWDAYSVQATMARLTARPPFLDRLDHPERQAQALQALEQSRQAVEKQGMARVIESYRQAVAQTPNDWQLHFNFGRLLIALKQHTAALAECTRTVELFPYAPELRVRLAGALVNAGRPDRALGELREALRLDPGNPAAQAALKSLTSDQEKGY